jgi:hypothetical protein
MEGCERVLPADGTLRAILPFVLAEWQVWEQTDQRPTTDPLPPAEILSDPLHLSGPQDLIVVQEPNSDDVLELARQAEASDLGGGTLEVIDRMVDRFCCDYPTAAPSVLVPRVEQRLRFLVKLLDGKVALGQHRHLLVAGGWLATLLACLQFDLGDREAAEARQSAAYTFAREAEHQELLAWTYELLAWWALVDRRFHEVIEYSRTGLEIAPNTSAGVQLAVQQAKGWSRLGDAPRADKSLRIAGSLAAGCPGRTTPPGVQRPDLDPLLGQQLLGQPADLREAAVPDLSCGEPAAGAVPCRHHLDEGQVEGDAVEPGEPLQIALPEGAARLVAVAVGGEAALGQPPLEFAQVRLVAPVAAVGEQGQLVIGEPVAGQVHDRGGLEQVGDHVLHEPHIGPIVYRWLAGIGGGAAGHQGREDNPACEPTSHHRSLAVACRLRSPHQRFLRGDLVAPGDPGRHRGHAFWSTSACTPRG